MTILQGDHAVNSQVSMQASNLVILHPPLHGPALQTAFFFGYNAMACFAFFLMLGTVGFLSSLLFVRTIFRWVLGPQILVQVWSRFQFRFLFRFRCVRVAHQRERLAGEVGVGRVLHLYMGFMPLACVWPWGLLCWQCSTPRKQHLTPAGHVLLYLPAGMSRWSDVHKGRVGRLKH